MTKALLLKTDGTHRRVDLPSDNAHETISELVADGGAFDTVQDKMGVVRGYLHDSGLLIGLPVNPVASLLFGINLVGDILVTNPQNADGENDGYDYDLEDKWFDGKTILLFKQINADQHIIEALEEDVRNMDLNHHMYSLTEEQMTEYMLTGAIPEEAKKVV